MTITWVNPWQTKTNRFVFLGLKGRTYPMHICKSKFNFTLFQAWTSSKLLFTFKPGPWSTSKLLIIFKAWLHPNYYLLVKLDSIYITIYFLKRDFIQITIYFWSWTSTKLVATFEAWLHPNYDLLLKPDFIPITSYFWSLTSSILRFTQHSNVCCCWQWSKQIEMLLVSGSLLQWFIFLSEFLHFFQPEKYDFDTCKVFWFLFARFWKVYFFNRFQKIAKI